MNAITPAVVKTRFATALYEADEAEGCGRLSPGPGSAEPEDVGAAAAFLASSDAAWVGPAKPSSSTVAATSEAALWGTSSHPARLPKINRPEPPFWGSSRPVDNQGGLLPRPGGRVRTSASAD